MGKYKCSIGFRFRIWRKNLAELVVWWFWSMLQLPADTAALLHPDPNFNFTVTIDPNNTSEVLLDYIKMLMMRMMSHNCFRVIRTFLHKFKFMQNRFYSTTLLRMTIVQIKRKWFNFLNNFLQIFGSSAFARPDCPVVPLFPKNIFRGQSKWPQNNILIQRSFD